VDGERRLGLNEGGLSGQLSIDHAQVFKDAVPGEPADRLFAGGAADGGRDSAQRADCAGWVRVGGRRSSRRHRQCVQLGPMRVSSVKRLGVLGFTKM
jgi:hypothetical protein